MQIVQDRELLWLHALLEICWKTVVSASHGEIRNKKLYFIAYVITYRMYYDTMTLAAENNILICAHFVIPRKNNLLAQSLH